EGRPVGRKGCNPVDCLFITPQVMCTIRAYKRSLEDTRARGGDGERRMARVVGPVHPHGQAVGTGLQRGTNTRTMPGRQAGAGSIAEGKLAMPSRSGRY